MAEIRLKAHYPWKLTKRLLESIPLLRVGAWPRDYELPPGYKGQASEHASYEAAIDALADLTAARDRLIRKEAMLGWIVRKAYWEGEWRYWYTNYNERDEAGNPKLEARTHHVQGIYTMLNGGSYF